MPTPISAFNDGGLNLVNADERDGDSGLCRLIQFDHGQAGGGMHLAEHAERCDTACPAHRTP